MFEPEMRCAHSYIFDMVEATTPASAHAQLCGRVARLPVTSRSILKPIVIKVKPSRISILPSSMLPNLLPASTPIKDRKK